MLNIMPTISLVLSPHNSVLSTSFLPQSDSRSSNLNARRADPQAERSPEANALLLTPCTLRHFRDSGTAEGGGE